MQVKDPGDARAVFSIREIGVDGIHWHMVGA